LLHDDRGSIRWEIWREGSRRRWGVGPSRPTIGTGGGNVVISVDRRRNVSRMIVMNIKDMGNIRDMVDGVAMFNWGVVSIKMRIGGVTRLSINEGDICRSGV